MAFVILILELCLLLLVTHVDTIFIIALVIVILTVLILFGHLGLVLCSLQFNHVQISYTIYNHNDFYPL